MRQDFLEGVLRELTPGQKDTIRTTDCEYISFSISVFNSGAVIGIEPTNTWRDLTGDDWNGYDFNTPTADAIEMLDGLGL